MTGEQDPSATAGLPENARAMLSLRDTWADPPPGLEEEILQAIHRERDEGGMPTGTPPGAIPLKRDNRARPGSLARHPVWLGVAAAAAAVLIVGIWAALLRGPSADAVAALDATGLAPGASGRAEIQRTPSGFRIHLDTHGLRPSPAGAFYEAWLKNTAGHQVAVGTFHARGGGQDVILWSGVDPRAYPTLTVTLQREDGATASSGRVVLTGTVR